MSAKEATSESSNNIKAIIVHVYCQDANKLLDANKKYIDIDESIKWDWKPFLDHGFKVPVNDDISSSDWNTSPGVGGHGLTRKTRTEAKLESDLYTEFKRFLMNYWETSGLEGRVTTDKDAVKKPSGRLVTFSEPPFDVSSDKKELPFFINRFGPSPKEWMKLKFHYEAGGRQPDAGDDSFSFVHKQTLDQLKGLKCLVGKPGIPCQVDRSIPHPTLTNVTINYKCYALRPSIDKNFLEVHAKSSRPPSDVSPLITFYEWIKIQTSDPSLQFGKSKVKLEEIQKLIKEKKINLGINLEERRELDTPFKYVPVRDLILNYFDKPWLKIKKNEDGRGINANRPLTYDLLPPDEVFDKFSEELVQRLLHGNSTKDGKSMNNLPKDGKSSSPCKSTSPISNDYKSYFCSSREAAYFAARNAGHGREPVEEWHVKGNPFKGHKSHKDKVGVQDKKDIKDKTKTDKNDGTGKKDASKSKADANKTPSGEDGDNSASDPDANPPHFRPRVGPTGSDLLPSTYSYNWKEWPSFYLLPPSKNSFGSITAYNEYVPTSGGVFTHFDTSLDPYFNDDASHFKYGDSVSTKRIGEYHCIADLTDIDKIAVDKWKDIKTPMEAMIRTLSFDDYQSKDGRDKRKKFWKSFAVNNHPDVIFPLKMRKKDPTEVPRPKLALNLAATENVADAGSKKKKTPKTPAEKSGSGKKVEGKNTSSGSKKERRGNVKKSKKSPSSKKEEL